MDWKITTLLVCIYGVVKEFRPATPFLTVFLESEKNFTDSELLSKIYPFWTYGYVISLIPIFILTDFIKYKPVIILESITLFGTYTLLVWGTTVFQMQAMQIFFGIASSAEVAYLSYLYAIVRKKHYTRITSYTRAAKMTGKFLAYSLAQFFVTSGYGSYLLLHQITLGSMAIIVILALFLPPVNNGDQEKPSKASIDETKNHEMEIQPLDVENDGKPDIKSLKNIEKSYIETLKSGTKIYFTNKTVLCWSLWWALSSCGVFQVYNYVQNLWALMQHENHENFNAVVYISTTFIGALLTFLLQYIKLDWKHYGTSVFVISSIFLAAALALMGTIQNLFIAYVLYIIVDMIYRISMTIACNVIASELTSNNYGFIFGCDTFLALIFETLLTLIVADEVGLALDIRHQFIVYSGYFIALVIIFLVIWIVFGGTKSKEGSENSKIDVIS